MANRLNNRKVAVLVADGFEQIELTSPIEALEEAGAKVEVIAPSPGQVKGWQHDHWGDRFDVSYCLNDGDPEDYDALLLPGGVMNPDTLRNDTRAVRFARHFFDAGKPVAAICHGPQLLVETGALTGRTMTSYSSIKTDLKNAGVRWEDREVVTDQGLVTSRSPDDLPAFNRKMVEEFAEGKHRGQRTA
ncbi:MAG: type 1 glutamine amidotransferase domain-containing protein [Pseudomonadota bacterium]|uniref:type 1 glutamine amidotransferase domain-containing protein n=1 Tax=Gallaecimonas pentaromativorans TaxID=584787 RepID=UPI00067EA289|nr:type 1 glutamine amidotransferase domain-containing protein [Gallaecimonas pentaromativorans]MED5526313.1 type 1 glutamine amidotransferase domain-containing protein [Pseudomonadota bacterium]